MTTTIRLSSVVSSSHIIKIKGGAEIEVSVGQ